MPDKKRHKSIFSKNGFFIDFLRRTIAYPLLNGDNSDG